MDVATQERDRPLGGHLVEVLARRGGAGRPEVAVPAPPEHPAVAGRPGHLLAHQPLDLGDGGRPIEPDALAIVAVTQEVKVGVDETGQRRPPTEVDQLGVGAGGQDRHLVRPDRDDAVPDDPDRRHDREGRVLGIDPSVEQRQPSRRTDHHRAQPSRWSGSLISPGSFTTVPSSSRAAYGLVPRTIMPNPKWLIAPARATLSAARYWKIRTLRGLVPRFAVELWSMLQWWISTPPAGASA